LVLLLLLLRLLLSLLLQLLWRSNGWAFQAHCRYLRVINPMFVVSGMRRRTPFAQAEH
jgi:hypothetical protein